MGMKIKFNANASGYLQILVTHCLSNKNGTTERLTQTLSGVEKMAMRIWQFFEHKFEAVRSGTA
jgi:hypothetical protein